MEARVEALRRAIPSLTNRVYLNTGTAGPVPLAVQRAMEQRMTERIRLAGCRTTDHFAGFQWTGRFDSEDVVCLLKALPEGVTEFMTHPGYCDDELRRAATRLRESREAELRALTDPRVREALREADIRLASYAELDARGNGAQRP